MPIDLEHTSPGRAHDASAADSCDQVTFHKPAACGSTGNVRTPLDDIASALHQAYITSEWHEQSQWAGAQEEEGGQFLPQQLLTSLLRAVVVAWNDPVDTLTRRMAMAESLGAACGLGESAMEQVGVSVEFPSLGFCKHMCPKQQSLHLSLISPVSTSFP